MRKNKHQKQFSKYQIILWPPGLLSGLLLCGLAMQPSLLPRSAMTQAVLGAVWFLIGLILARVIRAAYVRFRHKPPRYYPKRRTTFFLLAVLLSLLLVTWYSQSLQSQAVEALDINRPAGSVLSVFLPLLIIALLVYGLALSIRKFVLFIARFFPKYINPRFAVALTGLLLGTLGLLAGWWQLESLKSSMSTEQAKIQPFLQKPDSKNLSGSDTSFVAWEHMGAQGRRFVSGSIQVSELAEFNTDARVKEPIRVYVGKDNEPDIQRRAELVVRELERTEAFSRSAIVLYTPSGSGWVNEVAVNSVEYLFAGDVASAAAQYSDLSSFVQYAVDPDAASNVSSAVFNAVRERIDQMPADKRPKLFVYGESLGSMGSQARFVSESNETTAGLIDGAAWVGSPSASALSRRYLAEKLPENVRFGTSVGQFSALGQDWQKPRIAFLYNSDDPVVRIGPQVAFKPPDWLGDSRDDRVNDSMRWLPGITITQMALELVPAGGFGPGIGHTYKTAIPGLLAQVYTDKDFTQEQLDELTRRANDYVELK